MRTVPSAGARHAFETLLLVHRVTDVAPGLYQFDAPRHELHALETRPDLSDRLVDACYGQTFLRASAATFLWVGIPYRMTWRYGERGYRYLHLDAGHVAQNLYLAAEAIRAGACAVAAFDDQAVNTLLGLDGESAFLVYLAAVGKRIADAPVRSARGTGSSRSTGDRPASSAPRAGPRTGNRHPRPRRRGTPAGCSSRRDSRP